MGNKWILALAAMSVVAGCSGLGDRVSRIGIGKEKITFDGVEFRSSAKAVSKEDYASFTASVKPASASLNGARGAAEYEGIKYCIKNYGTSRIDWAIGPETDPAALTVDSDTLTFAGRCKS